MARKFSGINPEILCAEYSLRLSHCKICGVEIVKGHPRVKVSKDGTLLFFCPRCINNISSKLKLLQSKVTYM